MHQLAVLLPDADPGASPCSVVDADLWFSQRPDVVEQAKQLCRACPLARSCLAGALERREPWGVWGGELVERGVVVPRKRPMGRPRKADVAQRQADQQVVRTRREALAGLRPTA